MFSLWENWIVTYYFMIIKYVIRMMKTLITMRTLLENWLTLNPLQKAEKMSYLWWLEFVTSTALCCDCCSSIGVLNMNVKSTWMFKGHILNIQTLFCALVVKMWTRMIFSPFSERCFSWPFGNLWGLFESVESPWHGHPSRMFAQ